jgi:hypothetical protein
MWRTWVIGFLMGVVFTVVVLLIYPDKFAARGIERPAVREQNQGSPFRLKRTTPPQKRKSYLARATTRDALGKPSLAA